MRVADSPFVDSGAAAYRARTRLKRFQEDGTLQSLPSFKQCRHAPWISALIIFTAAIVLNLVGH